MRAALLALFLLGACAGRTADSCLSDTLKAAIDGVYLKSVSECKAFYAGDQECIKSQFSLNYRWEILRDEDRSVGAPGLPGPDISERPGHMSYRYGKTAPENASNRTDPSE